MTQIIEYGLPFYTVKRIDIFVHMSQTNDV